MASTCVTGFLVVLLVLQPWITLSYLLPPVFSPVYDDVCKEVVCGKGTCKPSNQSAFLLFECECYPGWKQANFGLADNKFLPCVVPDYDVCKEVVCGKGTCKPSNQSAFSCLNVNAILGGSRLTLALPINKFLPCVVPDCKSSLFL
ncbi:hypothetical protein CFP56_041627 [Quercus suber]|uniref:Uncharacterized protein n=1 Tax=Quercus suber TaxID=58331 RepID=A0AAW0IV43_QUESU